MQHKIVYRNALVFAILFLSIVAFPAYPTASHASNIAGAEYFFDNDPGEGSGISLPAADGDFNSPEESLDLSQIDTSTLKIGNHTLYVRFLSSEGVWGVVRPIAHDSNFVSPFNFRIMGKKWIAGAEYFIDVDPGEGNGIAVPALDGIFDDPEEELELSDIDISHLGAGPHILYLRVRNNEGTWGIIRQVTFEMYEPASIAGAEYFIDEDPGPSSGTTLTAKDGSFDSVQEEVDISGIDISDLSEGIHTIFVRFKNNLGHWGATDSQQFVVGDSSGDTDQDGMPDDWEQNYNLNPFDPTDAEDDGDNDDLNNLDEYLNNTDPKNPDTDGDEISDGEEVNYGTDPIKSESIDIQLRAKDVIVSLTGNNRIFVEVRNRFCKFKEVQFEFSGLNPDWYTVDKSDQNFILIPFGRRIVTVQLHLPEDCNIPTEKYPFHVKASWAQQGQIIDSGDDGNLIVTPNPNIYPLAIPRNTRLAGNTLFAAWKTDIPATSIIKYRKLGDEEYIEVPVATDALEHRVMLTDLDYFTYYEFYTESRSSCGGFTATDVSLTKTGKAVKFVDNVNEFWVDRDYNQQVSLTVTNTDMIEHAYRLSVINGNNDIVVGFVGDGTPGREVTLQPGESQDVELVIHAPDAQHTLYHIYLKMVSDEGQYNAFVDYSHAVVHVRPFVANLDIQPVESTPGMMTTRFRLINYGDTLSDIQVYVDENNRTKTWLTPVINHYRLENGGFVEFDIKAQEYATGTIYAGSGDYVVSYPFEIGCPPGTDLKTYTVNDISIVAVIKDWYCTNKMSMELPFAVPRGFGHQDLAEAALEVNFSLPMSYEKYDPHTVTIYINGEPVACLENTIPEGRYTWRFPTALINLGIDAPAKNHLTLEAEGITEGQYIVVTDFKIILNVDEMKIDLCVPPPTDLFPPKTPLPEPETKVVQVGPMKKYRPGDDVPIFIKLHNNDDKTHEGRLTILVENNSFHGEIPPFEIVRDIAIPPGAWIVPDILDENARDAFQYVIPQEADDIEYRLSVTFENFTMDKTYSILNHAGFWVRAPLIILHEIMGSELYEMKSESEPKEIWSVASIAASPCDNNLNYLQCEDKNGQPSDNCEIKAGKVIKNLIETQIFGQYSFIIGDIFTGLENYLINQKYKFHRAGSEDNMWFDPQNIPIDSDDSEDVFYFVYDWRLGNEVNADKLKIFIDSLIEEIKAAEGTTYSKANIIAHGMGGLVTKDLLAEYSSFTDKINKVIFMGTPNLGAVEPFSMMKHGLGAPGFGNVIAVDFTEDTARLIEALSMAKDSVSLPDIFDAASLVISAYEETQGPDYCSDLLEYSKALLALRSIAKAVFNPSDAVLAVADIAGELYQLYNLDKDLNGVRDFQMKTMLSNMPSAYQLLPSEKYLSYFPQGYYKLNGVLLNSGSNPTIDDVITSFGNEAETLLSQAATLHSKIDELVLPDKSYAIVGCKKCTTALIEEIEDPLTLTFIPGDGDASVPLRSALDINVHKKYAAQYAKHTNLPSQKGVRLLTRSLLKGYETEFQTSPFHPVAEYQEGFCGLPNGMRIVIQWPPGWSWNWPGWSWSFWDWPQIKIPGGSVNLFTGNDIVVNILGSDYRIVNDGVEIFVPQGTVYTLQFHGVDREYLDVKFQLMTEGGIIKTYVFFDIPLELGGNGEIDIDLTDMMTDPVLRLDQDGDGQFETTGIPPSYVLDESQSSDFTDPVTTASITGAMGQDDWHISNVSINLAATDNTGGSGILITRYKLFGDETFTDYSDPIQITAPGSYTLTYYSIDKNLNKETEKVLEFKIDNALPQVLSVTDEGRFTLNNSSFYASWDIEAGASGLHDVVYSLGTSPGLTDVIDWTSAGTTTDTQITGLSLAESCSEQIYINVKVINHAGVESEVVSSDGVIVLEAGGDPDGDGFNNESELAAGSNPCNDFSFPKTTVIPLKKGLNIISVSTEIMFQQELKDWLEVLGDSSVIEKVMVYDDEADKFITLIPGDTSNPSFILKEGEGLILYAKQDKDVTFTSVLCTILDLKPGFNLVGFACPKDGYGAYQLLNDLGSENVDSIQRYSTEKGVFETAGFDQDGQPTGVDFKIVPGEGYFVYIHSAVDGFRP